MKFGLDNNEFEEKSSKALFFLLNKKVFSRFKKIRGPGASSFVSSNELLADVTLQNLVLNAWVPRSGPPGVNQTLSFSLGLSAGSLTSLSLICIYTMEIKLSW